MPPDAPGVVAQADAGAGVAPAPAAHAPAVAGWSGTSLVDGTLDGVTVALGVWTLYCNALVFSGAGFERLVTLSPLALTTALGLFLWVRGGPRAEVVAALARGGAAARTGTVVTLALWAGAAALVLWYGVSADYEAFWRGTALLALLALLGQQPRDAAAGPTRVTRREAASVWLLAAATAALYLVLHRPDADDSIYGNFIAGALDFPHLPLLRYELIHGITAVEVLQPLPVYKVHAFELLSAVFASLADAAEPLAVYHLGLPTLFAAVLVLVYWSLFRALAPRGALAATLLVLLVLLAWGDHHRAFGNFGLIRLFQGKAVLVTVLVPLLLWQAMRFLQRPDPRRWTLLALVNAAMVGASSSGLAVAPMLTAAVFLGWWRPGRARGRLVLLGLASAGYPLLVAVVAALSAAAAAVDLFALDKDVASYTPDGLAMVLGEGGRGLVALWAVAACAMIPARDGAWGLVRGVALGALLLLSPWTAEWLARQISTTLQWRLFWAVPFAFLLAAAVLYAVRWLPVAPGARPVPAAVPILAAGVLFAGLPGTWAASPENHVRAGLPGVRAGYGYAVAREVVRLSPDKGMVLAPPEVALWVPTFRRYPYVICGRPRDLAFLEPQVGDWVVHIREAMGEIAAGDDDEREHVREFLTEVEDRCLDTVVLRAGVPWLEPVYNGLPALGYRRRDMGPYRIYYSP